MVKCTKLTIGEAVASSGGRVWKKLSAEQEVTLEGTWILNTELVDVDYPYPDDYGSTIADISFVKVNYDAENGAESANYKRFYVYNPNVSVDHSYERLNFYAFLSGETSTFYTNFYSGSITYSKIALYTRTYSNGSIVSTTMADLDKLSDAQRTVIIRNVQEAKTEKGYQNILAWFKANATQIT